MIQINCNVSGFTPPRDTPPTLTHDSGTVYTLVFDADSSTRGHFELPDGIPPNGWTIRWADQSLRVWLSLKYLDTDPEHPPLEPGAYEAGLFGLPGVFAYKPAELPLIQVSGVDLVAGGQRWVYRGANHFLALLRLILGESPVDYEGANIYRVFGTMANVPGQIGLPPLDPDAFPGYWHSLDELATALAKRGKYLDFCGLADIQLLHKDQHWCQDYINQANAVLSQHSNVLPCLGNEPWNNGFDRKAFGQPGGPLAWSNASIQDGSGDDGFDGQHWSIIRVHTRRDFPKMLTHCALPDPLYAYGKPIVIDEPFKFCDPTHGGYFDPRFAVIAGQLGRAVNGICFHSPSGVFSVPLNGSEEACRHAFFSEAP